MGKIHMHEFVSILRVILNPCLGALNIPCRFNGPQIRLVLNDATFPLSICGQDMDAAFGTCSLDTFIKVNNYSTSIRFQDETWNATCGVLN